MMQNVVGVRVDESPTDIGGNLPNTMPSQQLKRKLQKLGLSPEAAERTAEKLSKVDSGTLKQHLKRIDGIRERHYGALDFKDYAGVEDIMILGSEHIEGIEKSAGEKDAYVLRGGLSACAKEGVITDVQSLAIIRDIVEASGDKCDNMIQDGLSICKRAGIIRDNESLRILKEIIELPLSREDVYSIVIHGLSDCREGGVITDNETLRTVKEIIRDSKGEVIPVLRYGLPLCKEVGIYKEGDQKSLLKAGKVLNRIVEKASRKKQDIGYEYNMMDCGLRACATAGIVKDYGDNDENMRMLKEAGDALVSISDDMGENSNEVLVHTLPAFAEVGMLKDIPTMLELGGALKGLTVVDEKAKEDVLRSILPAFARTGIVKDAETIKKADETLKHIVEDSGENSGAVLYALGRLVDARAIKDLEEVEAAGKILIGITARKYENGEQVVWNGVSACCSAGVIKNLGDLKYVGSKLTSLGRLEYDFWNVFNSCVSNVKSSPEEVRENEHIPLPVFLCLKSIPEFDGKNLKLDWESVSRNKDAIRHLVHYVGNMWTRPKGELLKNLEGVTGGEADSIIQWTMTLRNLGEDYYPKFEQPVDYKKKLVDKAMGISTKRLGLSKKHKKLLSEHPAATETNLLEILSSLSSFMPERQMSLITEMIKPYVEGRWKEWRYGGQGAEQLEFLTEEQRREWSKDSAKIIYVIPPSQKSKLKALNGILESTERHVKDELGINISEEYVNRVKEETRSLKDRIRGTVGDSERKEMWKRYARLDSQRVLAERFISLRKAMDDPSIPAHKTMDWVRSVRQSLTELKLKEPQVDMENFQEEFRTESGKKTGTRALVETDDLFDMIQVGTRPVRTCQRWTEGTDQNKALPSYPADAFSKQFIIGPPLYDEKGELVGVSDVEAREVFRCIRGVMNQPLLMPEKSYPEREEYIEEFDRALREKANKVGINISHMRGICAYKLKESRNVTIYSDVLGGGGLIETPCGSSLQQLEEEPPYRPPPPSQDKPGSGLRILSDDDWSDLVE
ncbi:MAG: hypothetical protein V1744_05900 [Candidatus Altiarchaeota archaeon]